MKKHSLLSISAIILMITLIFTLSMQDATASNATSKGVTQIVTSVIETLPVGMHDTVSISNGTIRDLAHIGLFFLLGMLCMIGLLSHHITHSKATCITLLLGMTTALCDEIIQLGSVGRAFEWIDISKDMLGISVSIVCVWLISFVYTKLLAE